MPPQRHSIHSLLRLVVLSFLASTSIAQTHDSSKQSPQGERPHKPPKRDYYKFVTRPDIDAPVWDMRILPGAEELVTPGYWFVAFYENVMQPYPGDSWLGPHIYDGKGELVWSGASAFKHWNVFDFGTIRDPTGNMITLLSNHEKKAFVLDNRYQVQEEVPLVIDGDAKPNMHSFHVIDQGERALVLNIGDIDVSLEESRAIGFDGQCSARSQGFREVDLADPNGKPIFNWNARDHIGLDETTYFSHKGNVTAMCLDGWDILHLNSIEKFPDGDYLLSSRHTDALYKISHVDGSIVWRLGGTKSDFTFQPGALFSRQHFGRVFSQDDRWTIISLFDNAVGDGFHEQPTNAYSRGLVLRLDTVNMVAYKIVEYPHPDGRRVNARGSMQVLPNGNAFLGWAQNSLLSEYTQEGKMIMQARLQVHKNTYRAFKYPWIGLPTHPPDVVSEAAYDGEEIRTFIYMSWNGATEVAGWVIREVDDRGWTRVITTARRMGFETRAKYRGYAKKITVEAFSKDATSLGKTEIIHTIPPSKVGWESDSIHWSFSQLDSHPDLGEELHSSEWQQEHEKQPTATEQSSSTASKYGSSAVLFGGVGVMIGISMCLLMMRCARRRRSPHWSQHASHYDYLLSEEDEQEEVRMFQKQ